MRCASRSYQQGSFMGDSPRRSTLQMLNERIVACERCPRLRAHCEQVAQVKRAAYRDWTYWGKAVPNFLPASANGTARPERAKLLLVGLAPAAHGANRTGRMFTGDRSGDFLYRALYEAGLANQPEATDREDGLALNDIVITAALHCAPPANKPTREELAQCSDHLEATFDALTELRGVITLGKIAHDAVLRLYKQRGWINKLADRPFAHGALHTFETHQAPGILCTYHPSQQNTFTGRLTAEMLREVFARAQGWLD
jgi:uracil-DNA glycosylase family 4